MSPINPRIFLSPPYMNGNEMIYIQKAFDTNWIAPMGENVDEFENEISRTVGISSAAALSSGSAAILLSLKALGVAPGDTVFCSDLTFAGSCFPIAHVGAHPVFIDSEPVSCNMSAEALEIALKESNQNNTLPKAVIIVDLYGNPADYDRLLGLCEAYGVPVIEDAAEALGAQYHNKYCGTFGQLGIFSFNGNKIITTSGGGMVVSNNDEFIRKIRFWSTQAREPVAHYEHKEIGYNYRLSNICAGIGRGQLCGLEEKIARRKAIKEYYQHQLSAFPVSFIQELDDCVSNNWLSVMLLDPAHKQLVPRILATLSENNIESRPLWKPMHEQPVFKNAPFYPHVLNTQNNLAASADCISTDLFERGICLPSGDTLTREQQDVIIHYIQSQFI